MSGVRETRKKVQRSVEYIAATNPAEVAVRELTLIRQTVDALVDRLSSRLNEMRGSNAPDSEETEQSVAEAAREGFNTIYPDVDAG